MFIWDQYGGADNIQEVIYLVPIVHNVYAHPGLVIMNRQSTSSTLLLHLLRSAHGTAYAPPLYEKQVRSTNSWRESAIFLFCCSLCMFCSFCVFHSFYLSAFFEFLYFSVLYLCCFTLFCFFCTNSWRRRVFSWREARSSICRLVPGTARRFRAKY